MANLSEESRSALKDDSLCKCINLTRDYIFQPQFYLFVLGGAVSTEEIVAHTLLLTSVVVGACGVGVAAAEADDVDGGTVEISLMIEAPMVAIGDKGPAADDSALNDDDRADADAREESGGDSKSLMALLLELLLTIAPLRRKGVASWSSTPRSSAFRPA